MKAISLFRDFTFINFAILGVLLIGLYYPALQVMVRMWQKDQYNYCYLIPFVVLYLIWEKRKEMASIPSKHSWKGMVPIVFGIVLYWIGKIGSENLTLLISFWSILVGICWIHFGWQKLKTIGFALIFMLTMFPLPYFLNTQLMVKLRLISSKLGVAIIQLYGLPVTRTGNIIDLGFAKLQIVEACSGLNTLISLFVLSLLVAYFFQARLWKRFILVLSSVPLAIFTNSLRIAVTGILHKYFGAEVAQTFFHEFSGLVIFLLCIPILLLEIKILAKLPSAVRKSSVTTINSEYPSSARDLDSKQKDISHKPAVIQPLLIIAMILLGATLALSRNVEFREKIPVKKSLTQFPLEVGEWKTDNREKIDQNIVSRLRLSEYVILDYKNRAGKWVNFYVAYYESQKMGKSTHTPESCIPGSGWTFIKSGTVSISDIPGSLDTMSISRAVIQHGGFKQIVYYWFPMRGRILKNFYQVKFYNFWDALIMQRTEGALVRLITPIDEDENMADAEARLQRFVREIVPILEEYIPGKELAPS